MIRILYFSRCRDSLGRSEETMEINDHIQQVENLVNQLSKRGTIWRDTLDDPKVLIALNQEVTDLQATITDGDEIEFFPPVSGG